ncbi:MAG: DUF6907 domain-containing protein [Micrococcaceae bacterium]|nr:MULTISPECIES: hypothetical protein [Brevibacterium]
MHTADPFSLRPDWLTEPCPSWCCGDHRGQHHPADRVHFSEARLVPVIERLRARDPSSGEIQVYASACDAALVAVQAVGERDVWVSIGTEEHQVEVSVESIRRLRDHLTTFLTSLGHD